MATDSNSPRVLLVTAPFGLINNPPLGVSLIKAVAQEAGFHCDTWFATFEFAQMIGFQTYSALQGAANSMLLAERPFAKILFPEIPSVNQYYRDIVERFNDGAWPFITNDSLSLQSQGTMENLERMAAQFAQDIASREIYGEYDVIGFSSCYGQHTASLALARGIKENFPDKLIVFGGANCEGVMGEQVVRSFDFVDYAFSGDADVTFPRFLEALRDGSEVELPGVSSRAAGGATISVGSSSPMRLDMDALPYPDFSDFFKDLENFPEAKAYQQAIPIEGSRGCWWGQKHHCTFCGLNGNTMQFRSKSPERFVEELRYLVERWGEKRVRPSDNIMDMSWLKTVVPVLKRDRVHEIIFFEVKANLKHDELEALADAGITNLLPGVESLNDHVLQLMEKGTTAFQNVQLLKWCSELGMALTWNILTGFPGETPEDYKEMEELMMQIPHLEAPGGFARISVDRFSPFYNTPERFGIKVYTAVAYSYIYDLPPEEVENLAYWHYYECENGSNKYSIAPPDYAKGALRVRAIWEKLHGKVFFRYWVDDAGRVRLEDTRPYAIEESFELDALQSAIFRHTDGARSRNNLVRDLEAEQGLGEVGAAALDAALDDLVERRVLARSRDQYLALATTADARERVRPITEPRMLTV